jgi:hypothetical protein
MGDGVNAKERPERRRGSDDRDEQNATVRAWMRAYLAALRPLPNQMADTRLGDHIAILKGVGMEKANLSSADWALAERLAKRTGKTLERCLWAVDRVNQLNTPSYMGGELIQKQRIEEVKKQAKQAAKMAQFVANYKMTGADPALDAAVFKMRLGVLGQRIGQQTGKPVSSALGLLTAGR